MAPNFRNTACNNQVSILYYLYSAANKGDDMSYTFSASEYKALQHLADETNLNIRFRSDYSGRGMFGDHCLALDLPREVTGTQALMAIVELLHNRALEEIATDDQVDEDEEPNDEARTILDKVFRMAQETRSDSMGLGSIVYWPRTTAEDNGESGDEVYGDTD